MARIREEKLPEEAYGWYLDLPKYDTFVHAEIGGAFYAVGYFRGTSE